MRILITLATLLVVSAISPAVASERGGGVELPKEATIPVVVERLDDEAKAMGLSVGIIRAKVALRLRSNGLKPCLHDGSGLPYYLYIRIGMAGRAFSVYVSFRRRVSYTVLGKSYTATATTFSEGSTGIQSNSPELIVNAVLNNVDILSNEILKSMK